MTPPVDNPLSRARRGLRVHRWTAAIATATTGVVLVALASRLGIALPVALFAAAATAMAVWRAAAGDRRWRRAVQITRTGRARADEER